MKITGSSTIRSLALAAALSAGLGIVSPVSAQQHSFIVDLNSKNVTTLGSLGTGDTIAQGINDAGQVVGTAYTPPEDVVGVDTSVAFVTGPNGVGITGWGGGYYNSGFGVGINAAGQVVVNQDGVSFDSPYFDKSYTSAYISGPGATFASLSPLGTLGGPSSIAVGINDTGQVVGNSLSTSYVTDPRDSGNLNPFITGPNGVGMTDLDEAIKPSGINNAGQVVGTTDYYDTNSYNPTEVQHAFITDPGGADVTDLGTLGGNSSSATGVNDAGQVVGYADTAAGTHHAFITGPNGVGMTDLGTLGGSNSEASGINAAGQVVGWSDTATGQHHAFITGPNGLGMTDLNSLAANLPVGITLTSAAAINNHGQVAAIGSIPEPETYAMLLVGLGLVGFMVRGRKPA